MLTYHKGTVFNCGAQTIVNTVNCEGVMGKGIALEFKLRYPQMYDKYAQMCKGKKIVTGKTYIYTVSDELKILNFPTKNRWRYASRIEWIEDGLEYFLANYKGYGIKSIAFPRLGCSNGGLNWDDVKKLMEKYLNIEDIDVYICLDDLDYAEGTEKKMVNYINNMKNEEFKKIFRINDDGIDIIKKQLPVKRFYKLLDIKEISKSKYEKLFTYIYSKVDSNVEQLSFDAYDDKNSNINTIRAICIDAKYNQYLDGMKKSLEVMIKEKFKLDEENLFYIMQDIKREEKEINYMIKKAIEVDDIKDFANVCMPYLMR